MLTEIECARVKDALRSTLRDNCYSVDPKDFCSGMLVTMLNVAYKNRTSAPRYVYISNSLWDAYIVPGSSWQCVVDPEVDPEMIKKGRRGAVFGMDIWQSDFLFQGEVIVSCDEGKALSYLALLDESNDGYINEMYLNTQFQLVMDKDASNRYPDFGKTTYTVVKRESR